MAREMKIGDKVLCIKTHSQGLVVAGNEYVIDGFGCCHKCGELTLLLVGLDQVGTSLHGDPCGDFTGRIERVNFEKKLFVLPDLESLHQHRVEVSAKELLTVKEIQNQ